MVGAFRETTKSKSLREKCPKAKRADDRWAEGSDKRKVEKTFRPESEVGGQRPPTKTGSDRKVLHPSPQSHSVSL